MHGYREQNSKDIGLCCLYCIIC